ncbi:DUF7169 domain-containing protein [Microbacterium azadirachtae]|uniref:Uncharacterized protein n=1 Tax=Microbacterium azadirachtae TaxID=582680 RepID=A0A0F0LFA2_9MICO|nr:hypothetical protein [Microbacterium azadirachtae]KJL31902.1 hypothetical protein RS86_03183 [Microbacterium azadirachtae]
MAAPAPTDALDTLELFGAAYLRTHALIGDAAEAQWQAGATPRPIEDTTERSKGPVSDPTVYHLLDGRRIALREAVIEAEKSLREAEAAMADAIARLEGK